MNKVQHPLNLDKSDPNYILLKEIFKIIDSRKSSQIIASKGIKNNKKFKDMLKTYFISSFFGYTISFVLKQLNSKNELLKYFNIDYVWEPQKFYEYMARYDAETLLKTCNSILNGFNVSKKRGKRTFIVDGTTIQLDINFLVRKYSKEYLKSIGLKWGYSPSKGYYIGFKATVMMEYDTAKPVMILFHPGSPNDSKLFDEIMEEARRRKIIRQKDTIIFDKGYYSYKNYQKGIIKYKIVPFIFPKNNFNKNNLKKLLNYPLEIFDAKKDTKSTILKYISITKELFKKLDNWKKYKPIRGKIEDFFKLCKKGLNMKKIHSYTRESAFKNTILNVFLAGLITAQGYDSKTALQQLSEN